MKLPPWHRFLCFSAVTISGQCGGDDGVILQGYDDMPAHVKSSMFGCSLTVPISSGRLALGTWQVGHVTQCRCYCL